MTNFIALDLETANTYRGSICQTGITEVIDDEALPSNTSFDACALKDAVQIGNPVIQMIGYGV